MEIAAYILLFIIFVSLIVSSGPKSRRSVISRFELERRSQNGNKIAGDELRRELLLDNLAGLRRVVEAIFLVLFVICSVWAFGFIWGLVASVVTSLFYSKIATTDIVVSFTRSIYDKFETKLLAYFDKNPKLTKLFQLGFDDSNQEVSVSSKQELEHIVKTSTSVLKEDEKQMILASLDFENKTVEDIMTPRGVVNTIKASEMIGPLVLDELHKTGHSRFPVIDGDIDHVVGILHIKELLALENKKSSTARSIMNPKVYYVNQEQNLKHALAAFLKTRHHLFVVVNGYRETAGILSLEDVIEALIGQKIIDEYDEHDDLRKVAARSAKTNNNPPEGKDV